MQDASRSKPSQAKPSPEPLTSIGFTPAFADQRDFTDPRPNMLLGLLPYSIELKIGRNTKNRL